MIKKFEVKLDKINFLQNIIDFSQLSLDKSFEANATVNGGSGDENSEATKLDYYQTQSSNQLALHRNNSDSESAEQTENHRESNQETNNDSTAPEKKTRKRRTHAEDDYDMEDDFIDDDDMMYESTVIQPSQWKFGFFVWKGPIETFIDTLPEDAIPAIESEDKAVKKKKKPKLPVESTQASPMKASSFFTAGQSKILQDSVLLNDKIKSKIKQPSATGITSPLKKHISGSSSYLPELSLPSLHANKKRHSEVGLDDPLNKKQKPYENDEKSEPKELMPLNKQVEAIINQLKEQASKESFQDKKIFPDALRPILRTASICAEETGSLDDNFFNYITTILPYNTYTMKKLVGKMIMNVKRDQMEAKYKIFKGMIDAGVQEQNIVAIEPQDTPTMEESSETQQLKKFRWRFELKEIMFQIMTLELEVSLLYNHWVAKPGKSEPLTELQVKKSTYAKIVSFFPSGTIHSTDLSRQLTDYKKTIAKRMGTTSGAVKDVTTIDD